MKRQIWLASVVLGLAAAVSGCWVTWHGATTHRCKTRRSSTRVQKGKSYGGLTIDYPFDGGRIPT